MQLHLDEIATKVTPGAHAIVLLDQAGWHGAKTLKVPSNISLMPLPPRAPELNGQEKIWQTVCSFLDGGSSWLVHYETSEGCAGLADTEPHSQATIHSGIPHSLCRS